MKNKAIVFLVLVVASLGTPVYCARPASAELDADAVNHVSLTPPLARRAKGAPVLRAQILLDRAQFPTGEIDAVFGSMMERAVTAFQKSKNLQASGQIDASTWDALNRDGGTALVPYRISEADVAGPFTPIPKDIMQKAKLPALTYTSPTEALAEKFHASPGLLRKLNPGKAFASAGEDIIVPNVGSSGAAPKASQVIISKSDSSVAVVDGSGNMVARFPASTGSRHDPLPIGTWKITAVARNPVFNYNPKLFWDSDPKHARAKIAPGPNNPVGVVWIDLSKPHYGIHGSPEPATIGTAQSHGCIRLTNWDALALAAMVVPGVPVIMQE